MWAAEHHRETIGAEDTAEITGNFGTRHHGHLRGGRQQVASTRDDQELSFHSQQSRMPHRRTRGGCGPRKLLSHTGNAFSSVRGSSNLLP